MYNYYWTHREYELRSPYDWNYNTFNGQVYLSNRNLNLNIVHRIGAGNMYNYVTKWANWDSFAEHIYEYQPYTGTAQTSYDEYIAHNYTSDSTI